MLLRLERVHLDRDFSRRDDVGEKYETPACELGSVAEIEIFGQRIVLPAAGGSDRLPPPDARRPVEIEEVPGAIAGAVFQHEVGVEQNRLNLRQERVVLVDMPPARLHHADSAVGSKVGQCSVQEVVRRDEVCVEDRDELAGRLCQPRLQRSCLVTGAIDAMQVTDVEPAERVPPYGPLGYGRGLVG